MTDNYANVAIIDIETGESISHDRFGAKLLIDVYMTSFNWQAYRWNKQIDSWNEEFDRLHPDMNMDDPECQKVYDQFIVECWQPIVDQLNDTMSMCEGLKFIIEDLAFKMLDGWGHKIQLID